MKRLLGPALVALVALIVAPVGIALAVLLAPLVALVNVLAGLLAWVRRSDSDLGGLDLGDEEMGRGPDPPGESTSQEARPLAPVEYTSASGLGEGSIR